MAELNILTVNIDGGTTSAAQNAGVGFAPCKMYIPSGFSGASVSFQVAESAGGTYAALYQSDNTLVSYTVTAGRWYYLEPHVFAGAQHFKVVSASSETDKDVIIVASRLAF